MKRRFINFGVVFGVLLIFGIFKVPFEVKMEEDMRAKDLLPPKIELSDRNSLGQAGYAAALGGFRDVLASYYYLKAYNEHGARDWYEMERTLNTVVTLQPRSEFYWEMAGWQLAFNTFSITRDNQNLAPIDRDRLSKEYVKRGEKFLLRGLDVIPESYRIGMELVRLYKDPFRTPDYDKAREAAEKLLENGDMDANDVLLAWGEYVYSLATIPGKEYQAYVELKKLMSISGLLQKVPTQRVLMYVLQDILMIPANERISTEELLFNGENLVHLVERLNYEAKIRNTDKDSLKSIWKNKKTAWKSSKFTEKTIKFKTEIYVLQKYLDLSDEEKIADKKLFSSEEEKQVVVASLEYRKLLDAMKLEKEGLKVHSFLVDKIKQGKATRSDKELLALVQFDFRDEIPAKDIYPIFKLLYTRFNHYKELYYFWKIQNSRLEKRFIGDVEGVASMPAGNLLTQVRALEEELDVPEVERVSNLDVFSEKAYHGK